MITTIMLTLVIIIEILVLIMTLNMISEIGPELGDFADAEVLVGGDCFSAHIDHLHDHIGESKMAKHCC